jgi:hypothetical protein
VRTIYWSVTNHDTKKINNLNKMPATATNFGDGRFGINADETGIIIESITHDYTNSNKSIKDRTGNTKGISYYDETISISLNGKVPKTSPFSGTLASSLTLSNGLSAYLKGGNSGLVIVEGITLDFANEDYQAFKLQAKNYPNITS